MPIITILGTPVEFPNTGSSPNWAPSVIQFAELVELALQSAVGDFDVPPQVLTLQNNVNSNLDIPNLNFSTQEVRSANITYSVYRETDTSTSWSEGELNVMYNDDLGDWAVQREENVGNITTEVTFNITSTGQLQISTTVLSGTGYTGKIGYYAKALKKD